MAQKLRCVQEYRNGARGLHYEPGQEFVATPQLRLFLLADAPGCFEVVKAAAVEVKAFDQPPMHRAMTRTKTK